MHVVGPSYGDYAGQAAHELFARTQWMPLYELKIAESTATAIPLKADSKAPN